MQTVTAETQAQMIGRYAVRCDDCLDTVRWTDSMMESAAGGVCGLCARARVETMAKIAARAKKRAAAAR